MQTLPRHDRNRVAQRNPLVVAREEAAHRARRCHLRLEALRNLGLTEVGCMVATEDDTYRCSGPRQSRKVVGTESNVVPSGHQALQRFGVGIVLHLLDRPGGRI